ncbi:hypothetical protein CNMCM8980_006352 [Aspergillus fumigatiaffinis]|nr:hypothetical protein CNMCM8980_006352 [Aspergillus fumigatiaffinis]
MEYLRDIGSFQDGGLQDNFAANIARRISRRIWPTKHGVARLISMGTGISDNSCNRSPHYRHVFRDSFLRRGFDALMSNLDTQSKWLQMIDQLDDQVKPDYIRLNVPLKDIPCTIDNADAMDDYRNLVTLQPGSARMARKAATALLVARFFFVLDRLPEEIPTGTHCWYQGSIHCKGPTKPILEALNKLHPDGLEFITDRGTLGGFRGLEDICPSCQRYRKPVSILVHHPNETLDIHMRINRHEQWRISGFPRSMSSFAAGLHHPFGRPDHGQPAAAPCPNCDNEAASLRSATRKLHISFILAYFGVTGFFNLFGVHTFAEAGTRAAYLSLINLFPLYFSGGREFGAHLVGTALKTYALIHRLTGIMAVLQAVIHVTVICRSTALRLSDKSHFYGFLGACMFLSLLILPAIKGRFYEIFLSTHLACAAVALYALWNHTAASRGHLWVCVSTLTVTSSFHAMRLLFRNFVLGKRSVRMVAKPYGVDIMSVTLQLPRPWTVRAGERINLGVPSLGLFYLLQAHPFSITWWEDNVEGEAESISLMFRARNGFTRKLLQHVEPDREYWAWIDGPFGPSSVHNCGPAKEVGDYGYILMITSGIGIAAQLPYIKELLQSHRKAEIRTRRISLVWELDRSSDWESARDWLQQLVKEDDGYMLKVTIYDPMAVHPTKAPLKLGDHGLITGYSGKADWDQLLQSELKSRAGKLLVTGKVPRRFLLPFCGHLHPLYYLEPSTVRQPIDFTAKQRNSFCMSSYPHQINSASMALKDNRVIKESHNEKRSSWRLMCRQRLADHIAETLGVRVSSSDIRLKTEEDTPYAWHIDDPSLQPLFEKQLSKHSTGVYMHLCAELGRSFWAILPESQLNNSLPPSSVKQVTVLKDENAALLEELEKFRRRTEEEEQLRKALEEEVATLKVLIDDSIATIKASGEEIERWKSTAEYYQTSCFRCSDTLDQVITVLQDCKSGIPGVTTVHQEVGQSQ